MADLGQNIRKIVTRGVEAIGNTASSLAANTRQKINTISMQGRKQELLEQLGLKTYESWLKGNAFPDEMKDVLLEIKDINEQLQNSKLNVSADESPLTESSCLQDTEDEPDAIPVSEEPESLPQTDDVVEPVTEEKEKPINEPDVPVISVPEKPPADRNESPLSSAIDALFDDVPQVDKMADKVNSSLDEMGEQLKKFSSELGKQISDFAEDLIGRKNRE